MAEAEAAAQQDQQQAVQAPSGPLMGAQEPQQPHHVPTAVGDGSANVDGGSDGGVGGCEELAELRRKLRRLTRRVEALEALEAGSGGA